MKAYSGGGRYALGSYIRDSLCFKKMKAASSIPRIDAFVTRAVTKV